MQRLSFSQTAPPRVLVPLALAWLGCGALFLVCLRYGNADASLGDLITQGFLDERLARTLCALAVGAALAGAGVLLQTLTGNALADPGITGINAGGALAAILCAWLWRDASTGAMMLAAAFGAGLAGGGLWLLIGEAGDGGQDRLALRLPLAGLAIQALCLTLASGIILTDTTMQSRYLHWMAGAMPITLYGRQIALVTLLPTLAAGALLCNRLALLTLGAGQSQSLGRDPRLTVRLVLGTVVLLCASAVTLAGPIGFIGLIVPFATRRLFPRHLPMAYALALPIGGAFMMLADFLGRTLLAPYEIDAGLVAALLGGPGLLVILGQLIGRMPEADE